MEETRQEHPVVAVPLPTDLKEQVEGYAWARVTVGESGDAVYRLRRPGDGDGLYLKHARTEGALDLAGEMVRLRWLGSQIDVPQVRHFSASPDEAWLLMTALPGRAAYQLLQASPSTRGEIVDAIATFLRRLHSLPVDACPFNSDHRLRLREARWRIDAGVVDVADFDDAHRGWHPERLWNDMTALLPFASDPVVTHGDFSLDNIIVARGMVVGCIDVGRAGIADRYQDLAITWNGLGEFGPGLQDRFLAAYGIEVADADKIKFHLILDELF